MMSLATSMMPLASISRQALAGTIAAKPRPHSQRDARRQTVADRFRRSGRAAHLRVARAIPHRAIAAINSEISTL